MTELFANSQYYLQQIASLLLYRSVFKNPVGEAYINLLQLCSYSKEGKSNSSATTECLQAYSTWFSNLAQTNLSWQDYLIQQILLDSNPFSKQVQTTAIENLSPSLVAATKHDLQILQNIYNCSNEKIVQWVQSTQVSENLIIWEATPSPKTCLYNRDNWQNALPQIAQHYRQHGTGIFARYTAFRWQNGQLIGVSQPDSRQLSEIVGYESQKETLIKNTQFLLAGYTALHTLLYGSRGTGKSSLIKALRTQYSNQGLRIVEVSKSELNNLPAIVEQLRDIPQKFIIFVDDLSFEEDDDAFKALKVVLEGNITATPQNIVVYATTNRRHLIREYFNDRPRPSDSDEIHNWDTVQEKLSFSDRFGLTITFEPANQDIYLKIVNHLARQAQIELPQTEIEFRAKQWATRGNGRSGRTARQFIDYLQAEIATK
jgi:predicted AAA+ superfamily ATPase